jgi:hypothetical protein
LTSQELFSRNNEIVSVLVATKTVFGFIRHFSSGRFQCKILIRQVNFLV